MTNRPNFGDAMYGTVRETAIIPHQDINLSLANTVGGIQVRQLQLGQTPQQSPDTPIIIQRQSIGGGLYKFNVQFIRDPTAVNYAGTSVVLKTPNGITSLQAGGSEGPITFTMAKTNAPGSVSIQTENTTGTSTSTDFGTGQSNRINRT